MLFLCLCQSIEKHTLVHCHCVGQRSEKKKRKEKKNKYEKKEMKNKYEKQTHSSSATKYNRSVLPLPVFGLKMDDCSAKSLEQRREKPFCGANDEGAAITMSCGD
jgi:hypothetical protein